jgi:hypothetical protein
MRLQNLVALAAIAVLLRTLSAVPVDAGCGCNKPPPPLAQIRPAFGSPGDTVTLFPNGAVPGQSYRVTFTSGGTSISAPGVAVLKRDFADGVAKPQVSVLVPNVPIGPTSVTVSGAAASAVTLGAAVAPVLALDSSAFTTLPIQLALTEENGETIFYCYKAAVGADGTTYIPLNVGAISQHIVFKGFGQAYPIMFSPSDITIYNTQGVVMQLLTPDNAAIYAVADDKGTINSFSLLYDRHEFETYKSEHIHEGNLLLDPDDPAWHLDGTRHIDHDNLVIALHSQMRNGSYPTPGASKSFHLDITTALDAGTPGKTQRNVSFCQS